MAIEFLQQLHTTAFPNCFLKVVDLLQRNGRDYALTMAWENEQAHRDGAEHIKGPGAIDVTDDPVYQDDKKRILYEAIHRLNAVPEARPHGESDEADPADVMSDPRMKVALKKARQNRDRRNQKASVAEAFEFMDGGDLVEIKVRVIRQGN